MNLKLAGVILAAAIGAGLYSQGLPPFAKSPDGLASPSESGKPAARKGAREEAAPAVTVVRAGMSLIRDTVLVTGTLVPRLEILVAPEVEGLRVTELLVEEGERVEKGQLLARLEKETLRASLAQVDALRAKASAAITQAQSNIVAAQARRDESSNALDRAKPLSKSGVLSDSTLDQREAAARTAAAQLKVAEDGLKVSEAELAQVEAQRRDFLWKLSRTDVQATVSGVISRRNARIGGVASGSAVAQPMFNIIANGEIELEADVPEQDLARLRADQRAVISIAGTGEVTARIRLVMPEIDKATRQGRVRISIADGTRVRIGSFGRGEVLVRAAEALALPASAVLFGAEGAYVQLVSASRIVTRKVETGLHTATLVEIISGVHLGELIVAKAGTFLREGDLITPVENRSSSAKLN
jgi:HlyD family secretion protein